MLGNGGMVGDVEVSGLPGNKAVDGVSSRVTHASRFTDGLATTETSLGSKNIHHNTSKIHYCCSHILERSNCYSMIDDRKLIRSNYTGVAS